MRCRGGHGQGAVVSLCGALGTHQRGLVGDYYRQGGGIAAPGTSRLLTRHDQRKQVSDPGLLAPAHWLQQCLANLCAVLPGNFMIVNREAAKE